MFEDRYQKSIENDATKITIQELIRHEDCVPAVGMYKTAEWNVNLTADSVTDKTKSNAQQHLLQDLDRGVEIEVDGQLIDKSKLGLSGKTDYNDSERLEIFGKIEKEIGNDAVRRLEAHYLQGIFGSFVKGCLFGSTAEQYKKLVVNKTGDSVEVFALTQVTHIVTQDHDGKRIAVPGSIWVKVNLPQDTTKIKPTIVELSASDPLLKKHFLQGTINSMSANEMKELYDSECEQYTGLKHTLSGEKPHEERSKYLRDVWMFALSGEAVIAQLAAAGFYENVEDNLSESLKNIVDLAMLNGVSAESIASLFISIYNGDFVIKDKPIRSVPGILESNSNLDSIKNKLQDKQESCIGMHVYAISVSQKNNNDDSARYLMHTFRTVGGVDVTQFVQDKLESSSDVNASKRRNTTEIFTEAEKNGLGDFILESFCRQLVNTIFEERKRQGQKVISVKFPDSIVGKIDEVVKKEINSVLGDEDGKEFYKYFFSDRMLIGKQKPESYSDMFDKLSSDLIAQLKCFFSIKKLSSSSNEQSFMSIETMFPDKVSQGHDLWYILYCSWKVMKDSCFNQSKTVYANPTEKVSFWSRIFGGGSQGNHLAQGQEPIAPSK